MPYQIPGSDTVGGQTLPMPNYGDFPIQLERFVNAHRRELVRAYDAAKAGRKKDLWDVIAVLLEAGGGIASLATGNDDLMAISGLGKGFFRGRNQLFEQDRDRTLGNEVDRITSSYRMGLPALQARQNAAQQDWQRSYDVGQDAFGNYLDEQRLGLEGRRVDIAQQNADTRAAGAGGDYSDQLLNSALQGASAGRALPLVQQEAYNKHFGYPPVGLDMQGPPAPETTGGLGPMTKVSGTLWQQYMRDKAGYEQMSVIDKGPNPQPYPDYQTWLNTRAPGGMGMGSSYSPSLPSPQPGAQVAPPPPPNDGSMTPDEYQRFVQAWNAGGWREAR